MLRPGEVSSSMFGSTSPARKLHQLQSKHLLSSESSFPKVSLDARKRGKISGWMTWMVRPRNKAICRSPIQSTKNDRFSCDVWHAIISQYIYIYLLHSHIFSYILILMYIYVSSYYYYPITCYQYHSSPFTSLKGAQAGCETSSPWRPETPWRERPRTKKPSPGNGLNLGYHWDQSESHTKFLGK